MNVASDPDLTVRVADLLRETGKAHHRTFIATDGEDPEWPLWYAGYLQERIGELLNRAFTKSELVHLLISAEKDHTLRDPGADWTAYYARFIIERRA